jgi:hypothetical protein
VVLFFGEYEATYATLDELRDIVRSIILLRLEREEKRSLRFASQLAAIGQQMGNIHRLQVAGITYDLQRLNSLYDFVN